MKKVIDTITSVMLILVVVLAFLLVGVRLFGLAPYTVLSGSMEPTYPVGSMLYVEKVDPTSLQEGDPVTYHVSGGQVVTHRVVAVYARSPQGVVYSTKGDANNVEDPSVLDPENVIGRPVFHIPGLGYLSTFIQNPTVLSIAVASVVVLLSVGSLMNERFSQEKEESSNCTSAD